VYLFSGGHMTFVAHCTGENMRHSTGLHFYQSKVVQQAYTLKVISEIHIYFMKRDYMGALQF